MLELSKARAVRSITRQVYDDYHAKYKQAMLQSQEDEVHRQTCLVICARCAHMENAYVTAIY